MVGSIDRCTTLNGETLRVGDKVTEEEYVINDLRKVL